MDMDLRGGARVYAICTCPYCKGRCVAKLCINSQENGTDVKTLESILNGITIKTLSCNGELEESIQGSLKPLITDEKLYESVMQRVHDVFESRI